MISSIHEYFLDLDEDIEKELIPKDCRGLSTSVTTGRILDYAIVDKKVKCLGGVVHDNLIEKYYGVTSQDTNHKFKSEISNHYPVTMAFKPFKFSNKKNKKR